MVGVRLEEGDGVGMWLDVHGLGEHLLVLACLLLCSVRVAVVQRRVARAWVHYQIPVVVMVMGLCNKEKFIR